MKITTTTKFLLAGCIAILFSNFNRVKAQGTWTLVAAPPHANGGGMLLLSDGTVLAKTFSGGTDTYGNIYDKLTPNSSGSYANGTWSSIAPMANTRLYYSSQVLKDGRVYVAGGEYGTGGAQGEVYDPLTNIWTGTPAPGATISDANSEILEDGRVLQALVTGSLTGTKIYNPVTNTYINGPTALGIHNESAWIKLPDNSVLYVNRLSTSSERYIPATNTWVADATVPVQLYDPYGDEAGGAVLLPDGRAFFLGSSGHNAYYIPSGNTSPGTWAAAADFPNAQGTPDAPAAMMVNGKVLCDASPIPTSGNHFPSPTTFYEFDYLTNSFTAITAPGGAVSLNVSSYVTNMIDLPNGQVLYSRQNSSQYYVYTPSGSPLASGKPTISNIIQTGSNTYSITGTLFNGISQGATYGDDWQMSSNYPIVRLTSASNVYYARTSNWNSTGVRRIGLADTATFTLPAGLPNVGYSLFVVANGIASDPVAFSLSPTAFVSIGVTSGANPSCNGASVTFTANPINGGASPAYQWKVNGSNVGANSATYTTTGLTNGQVVTCVMTSNLPGVLGNPATSNAITMTVNNPAAPAVSISANATTICAGTAVTFTATPTNGGSSPAYQWKVSGVNAGTNSALFTTSTLTNGQVVTCVMTSNSNCVTTATATSNPITITINTNGTPSLNITATSTTVCAGTPVTFTAAATNAGVSPVYQWKVNGANAGTNSTTFSSSTLTDGQVITCVLNSNASCPATATLGIGANVNLTTSDVGAAYPTYYGNGRQQYLIIASELSALGLSAGNITSIAFSINSTTGDPATLFGYTIKVAPTTATSLSATFLSPTFTTVFGPGNYSPVTNSINTHTFSTPFAWDGFTNILVDICFSNQVVGTIAYQSFQTTTSFVSSAYYEADGTGGASACTLTSATGTGSVRPDMIFTDATSVSATSNPLTVTVNALPTVSFTGLAGSYNNLQAPVTLTGSPGGGTFNGSGISGNTFSPSSAGVGGPYTITYSYTDGNGCSNSSSHQTTVTNCIAPAKPGTITSIGGTAKMCPGDSKSYKITAVNGATSYNWSPPIGATIATGQGTVQVTVNFNAGFIAADTLHVVAVNSCGNSPDRFLRILRNNPAAIPSLITGQIYAVCNATGIPYSVTNVPGVSYNWSFSTAGANVASGQGTNAITATFNSGFSTGNVIVTASNGCGTSPQRLLFLKATPATPASITGAATVCANQPGVSYSTAPLAGVNNYTWGGPAGSHVYDGVSTSPGAILITDSTHVIVNFGGTTGNVKVRGNNSCGSGLYLTKTVTFNCRNINDVLLTDAGLAISPNPNDGNFTIEFNSEKNQTTRLLMLNSLGQEIYNEQWQVVNGLNNKSFAVEKLASGIYYVEIKTENGIVRQKVLKE